MAAIDSRGSGILTPLASDNAGDPTDAVRAWIAGLTGLPLKMVRRRWLAKPGTMPALGVNWCAVGVDRIETAGLPDQVGKRGDLEAAESGDVTRISHQSIRFVASFYGQDALEDADAFREGAQLWQNREALRAKGLSLASIEAEATHLPDLVNGQWAERYDIRFTANRSVARKYGVRTIANVGEIIINTERGKL